MAVPENFRALGTVGTAYKGEYQPEREYKYANTVYYDGSTYIALKNNPEGAPADDGVNWKYFARGASDRGFVTSVNGKDGDVELSASDVSAIPDTDKGSPDGVASLDHDGKVPKDQLPDDIGTGDLSVISDKFSEDKEYDEGDFCIHNDMLYKFINSKSPGEWDESVVEATNVGTELSSLNSDLTETIIPNDYINEIKISRRGNVVMLKLGSMTKSVSSESENHMIATLPEEYRPPESARAVILASLGASPLFINVNTLGEVSVRFKGALESGVALYGYLMYTV